MYASYFTSAVTPEVKAEWSSDLRVERSLEMGAEQSSDSKSGAGWSSDLGVGWNLEQWKCEMGCPLTPEVKTWTQTMTPSRATMGLLEAIAHDVVMSPNPLNC